MKDGAGRYVVVGFLAAAFAASASAQSLGEVAKQERERRAKLEAERAAKGDKPVKSYSESDVQNARGENFTQATGPVNNTYVPSSSSSPLLGRSGSAGKGPVASGGSSVSSLEQRVRDLEKQRAALPPGPFGASVACVEGAIVRPMDSAVQLKNTAPTRVCDGNAMLEQQAKKVQAQLDQARAALDQARR